MPAIWKLRESLKERGITNASEIRRIVRKRTSYKLSIQAVCDLLKGQPKMIRIKTMEALCDAFYCRLSDFFDVIPMAAKKSPTSARHRPSARNSLNRELDQTASDLGGKQSKSRGVSPDDSKVDFAAFYPDAHKFAARLKTEMTDK